MPEGRPSLQESQLSSLSMDSSVDYNELVSTFEESFAESRPLSKSRDSAKSVESLNTLLMSMPEISIPPLIHNPLPLQCLAANALPTELRREIDGVIAEYSQDCSESTIDRSCQQLASSAAETALPDGGGDGVERDRPSPDREQMQVSVYTCMRYARTLGSSHVLMCTRAHRSELQCRVPLSLLLFSVATYA